MSTRKGTLRTKAPAPRRDDARALARRLGGTPSDAVERARRTAKALGVPSADSDAWIDAYMKLQRRTFRGGMR